MKQKVLQLLMLLTCTPMLAANVSEEVALSKAKIMMPHKTFSLTSNSVTSKRASGDLPSFYIFNAEEGGFVIVSGDDRTPEILGYSEHGMFDLSTAPDNVKWLLGYYEEVIKSLSQADTPAVSSRRSSGIDKTDIAPMIQTSWGQGTPYNNQCPEFSGRCVTGCVATAMAQIINYHKWPEGETSRIEGYSTATNKLFMPELPATSFDWDNMTDDVIAKLMLYCGQAVQTDYGVEESGASIGSIPTALSGVFNYDDAIKVVKRGNYTSDSWLDLIYQELSERRPVLYAGESNNLTHMFILHGYKDGKYLINWGWGGDYDGYYELDLLNPGADNFVLNQAAVIGIQKENNVSHDPIIYNNQDLHLYFKLDPNKLEAMVGTEADFTLANAIARPPYDDDDYWKNPTNYWSDIVIPSTITYNNKVYTVTSIASHAFYKNTEIQRVQLPETIRSIGAAAFYWCINLESINIPNQVSLIASQTFVLCRKLKKLTLPNGISRIEDGAFADCQGLTEINIPGSCTSIGNEAFRWCISLQKLIFEDGVETLNLGYTHDLSLDYSGQDVAKNRGLFGDCPIDTLYLGRNLSLPEVSGIVYTPFYCYTNYCTNTTGAQIRTGKSFSQVEFGETMTEIPVELFWLCWIENEIQLPSKLRSIANNAFYNESGGRGTLNQSSLVFPGTLEMIGNNAFTNCSKLEIILCEGSTPPVIGDYTYGHPFWNCNLMFVVPGGAGDNYREDENWSRYEIYDPADELYTVNVRTPGTLYDRLIAQEAQPLKVYRLKLKGTLNADDWAVISNMSDLHEIDLSELSVDQLPSGQFTGNRSLVSIKLPQTLSSLEDNAFNGCTYLSGTISIPASCTTIGSNAFYKTRIEEIITNNSGALAIGADAFKNCYYLSNPMLSLRGTNTTIGENAFAYTSIQKVVIGEGVAVGENAFEHCENLQELTFENGVKEIGNRTFSSCIKLGKVSFEGTVQTLGTNSFENCNNISEVNIPSVEDWCQLTFPSIKSNPIHSGASLKIDGNEIVNIQIPSSIQTIGDYTFYNCNSLESISFGGEIHEIGANAFYNCGSLESITFGNELYRIGSNAFNGCVNLTELHLPSKLETISSGAFSGCAKIQTVDLPLSLQTLGNSAFEYCERLIKVVAHWEEPFSVGSNVFSGVSSDCYLYVPIGCALKYTNAGWNLPNMKAAGILSVKANIGGSAIYDNLTITNSTEDIFFTPYKSFYITLAPEKGYRIMKVKLNGEEKISELEENRLLIEEPEENLTLQVTFADVNIQLGDSNGDQTIDSVDIFTIADYILKKYPQIIDYAADMNDDGVINVTDIVILVREIKGKNR